MKPVNRFGITRAYDRPMSAEQRRAEIRSQREAHYNMTKIDLRNLLAGRINSLPQPTDFPNAFLYQTAMEVYGAGKRAIANLAATLQTRVFREDGTEFSLNEKFSILIADVMRFSRKSIPYLQFLVEEGMEEVADDGRYLFTENPFPHIPPAIINNILPPPLWRDSALSIIAGEKRYDYALYHYCALLNTAFAFKDKGNFEEAILWYKIAILINPSLEHAYFLAGHLYLTKQFELEKALEMYQQLLEVKPNSSEARENLAITYIGLDRHDEAFEQFDLCLKMHPENTRVHFLKALLMLELGRTAEAIDYCKKHFLERKDLPDEAILSFLQSDTLNLNSPSGTLII